MKKDTRLIHAGRAKKYTGTAVNPPLVRASTIVFDTFAELKHATLNRGNRVPFYGRRGTDTHFALQEAMCELEGGAGAPYEFVCTRMISLSLFSPSLLVGTTDKTKNQARVWDLTNSSTARA